MADSSRFIIKRKDRLGEVDDVVIDTEGLTIGRLRGNDLALNHPAVSRTHSGVKEIGEDFWYFNLSQSNGSLLNGELVTRAPLADGDVVQIGPYLLQMNYLPGALSISVEAVLEVQPLSARTGRLGTEGEEAVGTVLVRVPQLPKKETLTPGGTKRLQGTGMLTVFLAPLDQQALEVFWQKRQREAGKIADQTPLHPRQVKKTGKSQFNWTPTLDLSNMSRKALFAWGSLIVMTLSAAAAIIYADAYSPGELSMSHSLGVASTRNIAVRPNQNSCGECHAIGTPMQAKCALCHTTQVSAVAKGFKPSVYDSHQRAELSCTSCHTEHQGRSADAGLISYGICASCHNDGYVIKAGPRAGAVLGVPHGGSTGYPVTDGKWTGKLSADELRGRGLPETWATFAPKDQFHAIHQMGRMLGKTNCKDCHSAGVRGDRLWIESPRSECGKCHGLSFRAEGIARVQANCNTCHRQHGESRDSASLMPPAGAERLKVIEYLARLEITVPEDQGVRLSTGNTFQVSEGLPREGNGGKQIGVLLAGIGGFPWYGWAALLGLAPAGLFLVIVTDTLLRKRRLRSIDVAGRAEVRRTSSDSGRLRVDDPPYPHPVVDPALCIGCHACVEACPHDVLAIVNGIATPVALDQCMEDTGCQVECPTNPKACVVINATKSIPSRKVPARNQRFMTNVEGLYMIGDVSGVPLIKNAVNEGAQVIDHLVEDLRTDPGKTEVDYDVAIIGIGPAGLSATITAIRRGLKYVAIEQDKVVATIQAYPAGKFVFFKPDTLAAKGGISLMGAGDSKEALIESWLETSKNCHAEIREEEKCAGIKRENGVFAVTTEKGQLKEQVTYRARRVVLAIGNRGTPRLLKVPGEDIKIVVQPEPVVARHCPKCGAAKRAGQLFCANCGSELPRRLLPQSEVSKVKYKLSNPDDFVNKRCVVVGAGNSAVEAAVDLCGLARSEGRITFTRSNEVALVIRSDFSADLKLGNKMNVYDCIDAGRIKVFFRTEIREITEREVVLMEISSKKETARIQNDFVFALIGGERPTRFLEGLGIKIG